MYKQLHLLKWEFTIQNKLNNLSKYLSGFFLFCTLSMSLIANHSDIEKLGMIFAVISLPLGMIGLSHFVFKQDLSDGSLESLLVNFSSLEITLAKFISILGSSLFSLIFNLPIIFILFNPSSFLLLNLTYAMVLLLMLASALLTLIASTQCYFRSNTNFLPLLTMPLLIPSIIITGIVMQDAINSTNLLLIMLGINLVILPITFILASYLIKNIYNV